MRGGVTSFWEKSLLPYGKSLNSGHMRDLLAKVNPNECPLEEHLRRGVSRGHGNPWGSGPSDPSTLAE